MRDLLNLLETVHEISADEMNDFVEAFDNEIDDNVSNEHYVEHNGNYVALFVAGQPGDGFTPEYAKELASHLDAAVRPHGWFVAKSDLKYNSPRGDALDEDGDEAQLMCFIDVFPMFGERADAEYFPDHVYHVCHPDAVEGIQAHGLTLRTGGTDHITTANGRIYVALDKAVLRHLEIDMAKLRGWHVLAVFEITTAGLSNEWFNDVEMDGHAAFTTDPIPPSHLKYLGNYRGF